MQTSKIFCFTTNSTYAAKPEELTIWSEPSIAQINAMALLLEDLEAKTPLECQDNTTAWTDEELCLLVEWKQRQKKSFRDIADHLSTHTAIECLRKYKSLGHQTKKGWNADQDRLLNHLRDMKMSYKEIGAVLNHTDIQCKSRYAVLRKKQNR